MSYKYTDAYLKSHACERCGDLREYHVCPVASANMRAYRQYVGQIVAMGLDKILLEKQEFGQKEK